MIRFNGSVPYLAALLRVAVDRNLIECPSISSLCRHMATRLSTPRQETISPKSLRNHFDVPQPDALESLRAELTIWISYMAKLIEGQGR